MSVEHRRPLYAFAVLVIVCGLFLGHAVRSDALDGVLRAATPSAPADGSAQPDRVVIAEPQPAPDAAAHVDPPATPVAPAARRAPRPQPGQASTTKVTRAAAAAKVEGSQPARTPAADTSGDPADTAVGQPPTNSVPPVIATPRADDSTERSTRDTRWASHKPANAAEKPAKEVAKSGHWQNWQAPSLAVRFARHVANAAKYAERRDSEAEQADPDDEQADPDDEQADPDGTRESQGHDDD